MFDARVGPRFAACRSQSVAFSHRPVSRIRGGTATEARQWAHETCGASVMGARRLAAGGASERLVAEHFEVKVNRSVVENDGVGDLLIKQQGVHGSASEILMTASG